MMHSVHLIIGKGVAAAAFLQRGPTASAVDLREGWQAIPVDDTLYAAIEALNPDVVRPSGLDVSPLGLSEALAAVRAKGGGVAYVLTEYFGGMGAQAAITFIDGREVVSPQSAKGAGPIDQALRRIGVVRTEAGDEFDTIGLGQRRTMADYEPEGPVRLRGKPVQAKQRQAGLPIWVVMLVIAAVVGLGVMAAVVR